MEGTIDERHLKRFMWVPAAAPQLVPASELPLRVVGRNIVGASGHAIRLRGVNWYGAHMLQKVNNGLEYQTPDEMARVIVNLGFNHVRLSYSSQMMMENPDVDDKLVGGSLELKGLRSLEIYDKVVKALTKAGLLIIINNHVSSNGWCCDVDDKNSLWFGYGWTEAQWYDSLRNISERYAHNPHVVGYDLRNEVRPDIGSTWWYLPWWGKLWGMSIFTVNWQAAAQEGSKAVWQGAPDALVFVEGNLAVDLSQVPSYMMQFGQDCLHSRVVYSVHDYTWFSRWYRIIMTLDSGNWLRPTERLWWLWKLITSSAEADATEFGYTRDYNYGALKKMNVAPVWVGEFGTFPRTEWWERELDYMMERELDFAYWSVHGDRFPKGYGRGIADDNQDWDGLTTSNFTQLRSPWKIADLSELLAESGVQDTVVAQPRECVFAPALNIPQPTGTNHYIFPFQVFIVCLLCFLCSPCCMCVFCSRRYQRRNQHTGYTDRSSDEPSLLASDDTSTLFEIHVDKADDDSYGDRSTDVSDGFKRRQEDEDSQGSEMRQPLFISQP
jgi:hypothetical protein